MIGDKLLKATASNGADVLRKLDEVNDNLEQIREEIKWSGLNTQISPTESLQVKEGIKKQDGPWEAEGRRTAAAKSGSSDDHWDDQFSAPQKNKTKAEKASNYVRDSILPRRKAQSVWPGIGMIILMAIVSFAGFIALVTYY